MPPIDTVQGGDNESLQIPPHDIQGDTGTSDDPASHSQPEIQQAAATAQNAALGIPQHGPQVRGNGPPDYEQRFPEDKRNEELGPFARVWRTYIKEGGTFDFDMLEGWRNTINILLVFAGLFSAVVTTFVAQTSQSLQVDYDQTTATLLLELIRAAANGSSVNDVPPLDLTPHPTTSQLWVNGLWFTSLTLSLVTSLFAVLTKQWIDQYTALPSGTPQDRGRLRQFRYMGLEQWDVGFIIGLLHVLLSVSLGLFLVGLVIFLAPLQATIACVVGVITFISFAAYLVSNFLPIIYPSCPYKTLLSQYIFRLFAYIVHCASASVIPSSSSKSGPLIRTLQDAEHSAVESNAIEMDVQALSWLFNVSSNPSVQTIVVQSIGALPLASVGSLKQHAEGISELCCCTLADSVVSPIEEGRFDRLARASLRLGPVPLIRTMNIRELEKIRLSPEAYAMLLAISSDYPFGEDPEIRDLVEAQFVEPTNERLLLQPIVWNHLLQKALPPDISGLVDRDDSLIQLLFRAIPSSYWRADYKTPSLFIGSDGLKICSTSDGSDCSLGTAIVSYLYPFVADFFLRYRNAEDNIFHPDPTDEFPASQEPRLCALLAMAASPSIQRAAFIDPSIDSFFGRIMLNIGTYMGVHRFHLFDDKIPSFRLDDNRQTVLKLLFNLVSLNKFGSASMRSLDQRITLVTFLRVLISTSPRPRFFLDNWCTPVMTSTFVRIAFQDKTWTLEEEENHLSHDIELSRLESDELILYFLRSAPTMNQVFSQFVSGYHLDKIGKLRGRDLLSNRHLPEILDNFIIRMTPDTVWDHRTFQQYIFEPENLFTICAVHICGKNPSFLRHLAKASPERTDWSRCWRKLDSISEHFGLQLQVSPGWILHIISEFREFVEGQCTGSFGLDTPDLQPPRQALTGDEHLMNERSSTRLWHRLRPWRHRDKALTTEEIMMNRSSISQV